MAFDVNYIPYFFQPLDIMLAKSKSWGFVYWSGGKGLEGVFS